MPLAGEIFLDGGEHAWDRALQRARSTGRNRGSRLSPQRIRDSLATLDVVGGHCFRAVGERLAPRRRDCLSAAATSAAASRCVAARFPLASPPAASELCRSGPMAGASPGSPASEKPSCAGRDSAMTIACRCRASTCRVREAVGRILRQQLRDHAVRAASACRRRSGGPARARRTAAAAAFRAASWRETAAGPPSSAYITPPRLY